MANPFRVPFMVMTFNPGLSLRSNPGLELANAFGVLDLSVLQIAQITFDVWSFGAHDVFGP